jgi:hypothetical protein
MPWEAADESGVVHERRHRCRGTRLERVVIAERDGRGLSDHLADVGADELRGSVRKVAERVEGRLGTPSIALGVEQPERVLDHLALAEGPCPVAAYGACHGLEHRDSPFADHR